MWTSLWITWGQLFVFSTYSTLFISNRAPGSTGSEMFFSYIGDFSYNLYPEPADGIGPKGRPVTRLVRPAGRRYIRAPAGSGPLDSGSYAS